MINYKFTDEILKLKGNTVDISKELDRLCELIKSNKEMLISGVLKGDIEHTTKLIRSCCKTDSPISVFHLENYAIFFVNFTKPLDEEIFNRVVKELEVSPT